jgi:hypothetical protein
MHGCANSTTVLRKLFSTNTIRRDDDVNARVAAAAERAGGAKARRREG